MAKKNKLKNPTVALSRDGYKFVLTFSNMDTDADYIHIKLWVWEAKDKNRSQTNFKTADIGAKSNSSWSFTLKKDIYYPFVADGTADNPKESDLSQTVEKIVFQVSLSGKVDIKDKKGKVTGKKEIYSKPVVKTYEFGPSVPVDVAIVYNQDNTSFTFGIDQNDDYSLDSNKKRVTTRAWGWLTKQVYGGPETIVQDKDCKGRWWNKDVERQIRRYITATISPKTPEKYTIYAYGAGPGGKSDVKSAYHVFAIPLAPMAPTVIKSNVLERSDVDNGYGIYDVIWSIDTAHGWYPVDKVTIQYRDQDEYKEVSDIYDENMGGWSNAKDNIHPSITRIRTDDIGAIADDNVRYFRIVSEHDGNSTPGYFTGVVGYGKPSNVTGVSATQDTITKTIGSKNVRVQVLRFRWTPPTTKLYGTDPNTRLYNGGTLGPSGRARILIFKNSTATIPIKTIYYEGQNGAEWTGGEWVYEIPETDLDKSINYCFQVRVGLDTLDPGAKSDDLWINDVIVPAKCENVQGTKLANNTTVEVTWENPSKDDTVRNGVQIAWSTFPDAWNSNELPSTTDFDNGAMTKAYITGLTAGEYYYFWVRRYEDDQNGNRNYSIWSDPSPGVLLADKPDKPAFSLSRTWVKEGGSLSVQWSYSASGNIPQKMAVVSISKNGGRTWDKLAVIEGEETKCSIDLSEKVGYATSSNLVPAYKYPAGTYYIKVDVFNDMGFRTSDGSRLVIADKPTCSITSSSIVDYTYKADVDGNGTTEDITVKALRNLPLTVDVSGDGDLNLYVYSIGSREIEHPDSIDNLYNGDCVWTCQVDQGVFNISNAYLADNSYYRVQLECVDRNTSLKSEPQYIDFYVCWEHQAISPIDSTVTINKDGSATLVPVKPEGALDTDVCDIYRTTVDGRYLCHKGIAWGTAVVDKLPTFGDGIEHAYCFCTRTLNGDEAWVDVYYELGGSGIIINYGNNEVRLPWNAKIDDDRTKQGEIRNHLGGTKTYFGQPQIDRNHSLSAEIIKMDNSDIEELLFELSRYSELCYIRTSNGMGYPATVDVSINREYNNKIVSVSLSAKEVDSVNEFLGEVPSEETIN